MVVGVPGENLGATADAGVVEVFYGGGGGLPGVGDQLLRQGAAGMAGAAEAGDRFGAALSSGLVDTGDEADLAVGAPGEDVGATADAGAVVVLISPTLHQLLTQGGPTTIGSVPGATESGDQFGSALGAADFDGNNADNLVIGTPGENLGAVADAGAVISLCGFDGQFDGCGDGVLTQGNPEAGDLFAASLSA